MADDGGGQLGEKPGLFLCLQTTFQRVGPVVAPDADHVGGPAGGRKEPDGVRVQFLWPFGGGHVTKRRIVEQPVFEHGAKPAWLPDEDSREDGEEN